MDRLKIKVNCYNEAKFSKYNKASVLNTTSMRSIPPTHTTILTLSVLISDIYGVPSNARNLTPYIYGQDFTGDFSA
jgi:hypothetical protein